MSGAGGGQLLCLLDEAFEGNDEHSLLGNLRHVVPDDWVWKPAGGGRTIRDIAYHAGVAKYLYADHLFSDATMDYRGALQTAPVTGDASEMREVIAWMREGHRRMRDGLAGLDDADLFVPRRTHYGETAETRWIVSVVIEHDVYHAGEINHLRALHQGDDRWPWEQR